MPRKARELGPLEVKRLLHPGGQSNVTRAVGGVDGLMIQITPSNAKSWVLRTVIAGKRRNIGLGSYPTVSLAQAREAARENREQIRQGIDPVAVRRATRAALQAQHVTFAVAMERFLEVKLVEFDNAKHAKQWRATLDRYALPALGTMPVAEIEMKDVLRALSPIWLEKNETASRLRGRIEAVLAWAKVHGYRQGENPARWAGNLDQTLQKPGKVQRVVHHGAVTLADLPNWYADVQRRTGTATRALEFLALTASRSGEVRGATWSEFDLSESVWTIPRDRMKAGREHRVALQAEAIKLLTALPRMAGTDLVFPAVRGGQLSDMSLSACMKRIHEARDAGYFDPKSGRPSVPHGLRSSFRQWAAEQGIARDLAEMALAHTISSEVERAYQRSDMLERRRQVMAAWAAFLKGEERGDVVKLGAVR